MIAALQDMGNVGSIAIDFIKKSLDTRLFRYVLTPHPNYVVDKGGHIEFQQEKWEYHYTRNIIIFGGGIGQPQTNHELYELCQDVIDIAKLYSVQLIYTLGAFHTDRTTPGSSLITGFNGMILGYAKKNNIQGIGLYAEIDDPQMLQYRSAKSLLVSLEKLTYQKFSGIEDLDEIAEAIERELDRMKKTDGDPLYRP
jgi:proteasome assembly chaperone (PAC2) family protein